MPRLPKYFTHNFLVGAVTITHKAGEFYTKLFGRGSRVQKTGANVYTTFLNGERKAGGMLKIAEEWDAVPSDWMVYFTVEDCDKSVEKAKALEAAIKSIRNLTGFQISDASATNDCESFKTNRRAK